LKEINNFIPQVCIKLTKSNSKDICTVTIDFYVKYISIYQAKKKNVALFPKNNNSTTEMFLEHQISILNDF